MNQRLKLFIKCLLLLLVFATSTSGQPVSPKSQFPFNLDYLIFTSSGLGSNDSIVPVYRNSAFTYINTYTGANAFNNRFEEAYPFYRGYSLVKEQGKYSIINSQGEYIFKDKFPTFTFEANRGGIMFDATHFFLFNGKLEEAPFICEDPIWPPFAVAKQGKKLHITTRTDVITGDNQAIKQPLLVCDKVLRLSITLAVAMTGKRIGAINARGQVIIPFEYKEYSGGVSRVGQYDTFFALKKDKLWHYYHNQRLLFTTPVKAISYDQDFFIYNQPDGLLNYFNNEGKTVLPKGYKKIVAKDRLVLNSEGHLVMLGQNFREIVYY